MYYLFVGIQYNFVVVNALRKKTLFSTGKFTSYHGMKALKQIGNFSGEGDVN